MTSKSNFFDFATTEMSHSSFWAWLISQLGHNTGHEKPIADLLNAVFCSASGTNPWFSAGEAWDVGREHNLGAAGRVDIYAETKVSGKVLLIESKLDTQADKAQIDAYVKAIDGTLFSAFIDLGFDIEKQHDEIRKDHSLANVEDLHAAWRDFDLKYKLPWLVQEYFAWVETRHRELLKYHDIVKLKFSELEQFKIDCDNERKQFCLFKWIFEQIESGTGYDFYHQFNHGPACTQLRFFQIHEKDESRLRGLFFRIEASDDKERMAKCTLRFYTRNKEHDFIESKKQDIKRMWAAIEPITAHWSAIEHGKNNANTKYEHLVCHIDIEKLADRSDQVIAEAMAECFSEIIKAVKPVCDELRKTS